MILTDDIKSYIEKNIASHLEDLRYHRGPKEFTKRVYISEECFFDLDFQDDYIYIAMHLKHSTTYKVVSSTEGYMTDFENLWDILILGFYNVILKQQKKKNADEAHITELKNIFRSIK